MFYETEKFDEGLVEEAIGRLAPKQEEKKEGEAAAESADKDNFLNMSVKKVKPFSMEEFMAE